MKFTLKEKQMDEARPARPTAAAARKATPENPYVLPAGSRKPAATAPTTTAAPTTAPATAPAAQPGPKFGRKPLGAPVTDAPVGSKQAAAQQGAEQGPQQTEPKTPAAPQPPAAPEQTPAKPVSKEKSVSISKKIFGVIPWLSTKIKGDPKLLQAYMGTLNKAQQFAGTPSYIPIIQQGLIAAGVPKAQAEQAARAAAIEAPKPATQTAPGETASTTTPAAGKPAADTAPAAGKPAAGKPAADTAPAAGKPDTAAAATEQPAASGAEQPAQQITQENAQKELFQIAQEANVPQEEDENGFSSIPEMRQIDKVINRIGEENINGVWQKETNGDSDKYIITKFTDEVGKLALYIPWDSKKKSQLESIPGNSIDVMKIRGFTKVDDSDVVSESRIFKRNNRGIFVLKG